MVSTRAAESTDHPAADHPKNMWRWGRKSRVGCQLAEDPGGEHINHLSRIATWGRDYQNPRTGRIKVQNRAAAGDRRGSMAGAKKASALSPAVRKLAALPILVVIATKRTAARCS